MGRGVAWLPGVPRQRERLQRVVCHAVGDARRGWPDHVHRSHGHGAGHRADAHALGDGAGRRPPLWVTAPAGVTATISPTQVTSGGTATLTVSASSAVTAAQVVVSAGGTTGAAAQTHTASLLLNGV